LFFALMVATSLADAPAIYGLEPPRVGEIDDLKRTGEYENRLRRAEESRNHKINKELLDKAIDRQKRRVVSDRAPAGDPSSQIVTYAPPAGWSSMPSKGAVKTLALLIDFPDYPHVNTGETITSNLFGPGDPSHGYFDSLANYYRRSSYQQLNITGTVLGWYRTGYDRSTIVQSDSARENLIKEVIDHYNSAGHDFSQYDNDNDGYIDCLMVYWSGPDNGWANFWWGQKTTFGDSSYTVDGKKIGGYTWQWESNPVGSPFSADTAIHELGHMLGLPDYYDYDPDIGPKGGVGGLDIMDGSWGDHNSFSKWVLDWISPTVVSSGTQSITLNPSGTSNEAVLMMPDTTISDLFSEFFLLQNRSRSGNDIDFPGNGLIIWHVDATLSGGNYLYNNSNTSHKLLRLMEADGLEKIETCGQFYRCADAGDYYVPGTSFGDHTTPSSKSYQGQITGVTVSDIHGDVVTNGSPLTATFSVPTAQVTVTSTPSSIPPIIVDGQAYPAPRTFTWVVGSTHTLDTLAMSLGDQRDRYVFLSWDDGGSRQHTITVPADAVTYTANFKLQYELRTSVNPSGSGNVIPDCGSGCWFDNGSSVDLSASPANGYLFGNWTGGVNGTSNPISATIASALSVTANFALNPPSPNLSVSPAGSLSFSGTQGGPFSPASGQYIVQNTGGVTLDWTASRNQTWVTLSPAGGTLPPGQSMAMTVSINVGGNSLPAGSYGDTVTFANATNGNGNTSRGISLTVNPAPASLAVSPAGGLSFSGTQGGPFSPASGQYILQNTGGVPLDWTASKGQSWVTLSPTGGRLSAGQGTTVSVSINVGGNSLPAASYGDTVTFTNATNGNGNTSRGIVLVVTPVDPFTLMDLTISGGPATVDEGNRAAYTATAKWGDGTLSVANATWSVTPTNYASIGATTGLLETMPVPGDQTVTVQASFTSGGMTRTATKTVTIVDVQDGDGDGVATNEEMSPDGVDTNYDGNGDGIPDWKQDNVASLYSYDRRHYVTMETNFRFADVRAVALPARLPPGVSFPYGLFAFRVRNVPPGGFATVRFYVDAEWPNVYYKYGPTPLVPTPSWYNFAFDILQGTGAITDGFTVTLHFKDGEMGDDDLTSNGVVLDDGGPGVSAAAPPPTSSGGGGGCDMAGGPRGTDLRGLGGAYGALLLVLAWLRVRGTRGKRGRPESEN
jgi:M6 family metalloprotease-like protein